MFRKLLKYFFRATLLVLVFVVLTNVWVILSTQKYVYQDTTLVPAYKVGLILGTSKKTAHGYGNPYFTYRIEAAAKLYHAGKVKHLILSGDNRTKYYNEPLDMQKALLEKGVPESAMTLDYAGLRTLDSIVRCNEIFGQSKFLIISQKFHLYRALFIASKYDLEASAFSAETPELSRSFKTLSREILARPKAIIDLYILDKKPKFAGEKVLIKIN